MKKGLIAENVETEYFHSEICLVTMDWFCLIKGFLCTIILAGS